MARLQRRTECSIFGARQTTANKRHALVRDALRVHLRLAPVVVLPLVEVGATWAAFAGAAGRPASRSLKRATKSAKPSALLPVPSAFAKATNVPIVNKLVAPACLVVGGLGTPKADATLAKPPEIAGRFTDPQTHLQSTTAGKYSPSCSANPLAVSGSGLQVSNCGWPRLGSIKGREADTASGRGCALEPRETRARKVARTKPGGAAAPESQLSP